MKIRYYTSHKLNDTNLINKTIFEQLNKFTATSDKISFTSTLEKTELMLSTTCFFRDNSIIELCNIIKSNFNNTINADISNFNKPPIEIYSYAASDGSEAYSIALGLINIFGEEKAKKLFKIHVLDVSRVMVERGQKSIIYLKALDILKLIKLIDSKFSEYFLQLNRKKRIGKTLYFTYAISPKLREMVDFKEADFFDDITNPAKKDNFTGNRVILFRNVLYHYSNKFQKHPISYEGRIKQITNFMNNILDSDALICFSALDLPSVKQIQNETKDSYIPLYEADGIILREK